MTELLVTGGAGFIGSNFVRHWRRTWPQDGIVVLDALAYAGNKANLADVADIEFVHGDVRDTELVVSLLTRHRTDTIVNFAAETHVDRSIATPERFVQVNVGGAHALMEAAKRVWLDRGSGLPHRFHQVSTDEVFGSIPTGSPPATENTRYAPSSPYAATKAAADHLVQAYGHTYGLQATITRSSNNYGPFQFPEKLIPLCLINALLGKRLPVYGTGENKRSWMHVNDTCRAIELVLTQGVAGASYNIGTACEQRNLDVVAAICEFVDDAFRSDEALRRRFAACPSARGATAHDLIEKVEDRPGHDDRYAMTLESTRAELGFTPRHQWSKALPATLKWYVDNERWWRPVVEGPNFQQWLTARYRQRE